MTKEIEEYFIEKCKLYGFKVLPLHHPDFTSKDHVDSWVEIMKSMFCE